MASSSPVPDASGLPDPLVPQVMLCAHQVAASLGGGFSEKVYENALAHELGKAGLDVRQQQSLPVMYDGLAVGAIIADLIVGGRIILELKSVRWLDDTHVAQCATYLKATEFTACLLINFGCTPPEIRKLFRNRGEG